MFSFSSLIVVAIAFVIRGPTATSEPLRQIRSNKIDSDSVSNDVRSGNSDYKNLGNRNRNRQHFTALTYVESPYGKKKRDVIMDLFPLDKDLSMPSHAPLDGPSLLPSSAPIPVRSEAPSTAISLKPSRAESMGPSLSLVTGVPESSEPTSPPTLSFNPTILVEPTMAPIEIPSENPSASPSEIPSKNPSTAPREVPSGNPTALPNEFPSLNASSAPSNIQSENLTIAPSDMSSENLTSSSFPSFSPSFIPTFSNFTDDFVFNFTDDFVEPTPTNIPLMPSPSPTLEECLISEEERSAQIFVLLDAAGNSEENRDLGTPQGLAADWLINQDFREECPSKKIVQRWVIAVVYFATNGESWEKCSAAGSDPCGSEFPFAGKRRFLTDYSECEWAGITCNDDDCVTEIEFEDNGLVGTIPTELGLLTDLAVLGMERGGLSSAIPSEIGLLTKLLFVDLDFNELSGSLPTALYSLTNLETLDLNDNFLEGDIALIGVFGKLEFLQLQSNQFTGTVPEDAGNLTLMTTFNLHENLFTGIIPESVCDLRENNGGLLKSLIADCANSTAFGPDIECDCCSSCRG